MFLPLAVFLLAFSACEELKDIFPGKGKKDSKYSNKVILEWNELAYESGISLDHPLLTVHVGTKMHLAMHDALNAIDKKYASYAYEAYHEKADEKAAVATAAHTVLTNSFPDFKSQFDALLDKHLEEVKSGEKRKENGVEAGKAAAEKILSLRQDDGAFLIAPVVTVEPSDVPGVFQAVPPLEFNYAPGWKDMAPFALLSPSQFRSAAHPNLNSEEYAEAFNEVKNLGSIDSPVRTEEESLIAKFWYEFSEIGWNRIARVAAKNQKPDLYETARLFALLNMALSDAYISGWESKAHWNFWRPYTAIQKAEHDGNPDTAADATWESAEPTPPVPDYPSTHSALGNAGAAVLSSLLGDEVAFAFTSTTAAPEGPERFFNSFTEAADENATSRVIGGLHFRFACEAGQELGNKVGQWTVQNYLTPIY